MGLRDTFIFVFMVMAVQWAREGRWWFALLPLYFLYAIKFQNFFILGPILLIYVLFGIWRTGISGGRAVAVVAIAMVTLIAVSPIALPEVNKFRGRCMWRMAAILRMSSLLAARESSWPKGW